MKSKDPFSLAEREGEEVLLDRARQVARAVETKVRSLSDDDASIPPNRDSELVLGIAEDVVADLKLDVDRAGPVLLYHGEFFLMQASLTDERLALGAAVLQALYEVSTLVRDAHHHGHEHLLRTLRECRMSWTIRPRAERSVSARSRRRSPHRAGRSAVHGASRRSSARSGDSGSDDPDGSSDDDDPAGSTPPLDGRRFCACGCGLDISHKSLKAKHFDDTHRQRKHRHPDGGGQPEDPYLTLSSLDRDALQALALGGCRCNGSHILDAEFGDCVKCGRPYRDEIPDGYLKLWEQPDRLPSYLRAVSYDHSHRVMA